MKPLAIDLFCGLGGWTEGLLAEGYRVIGYDIERHEYGDHKYPSELVLEDVREVHGSRFKGASLIVASPPCTEYSYMAMPWSRAKQIARALRGQDEFPEGYKGSRTIAELNALFDACFRIQREASAAAGRHIPMVVENVRGAQPWVGRARANFGSFYLWGDVPALMPIVTRSRKHFREMGAKTPTGNCTEPMWKDRPIARLAHATPEEMERHGFKVPGFRFDGSGRSFQSASVAGTKNTGGSWFAIAHNTTSGTSQNAREQMVRHIAALNEGVKQAGISGKRANGKGDRWFQDGAARSGSKSNARKAASAAIAKIPLVLSRHIAAAWKPDYSEIPPDSRQTVTSSAKGHERGSS